MLRRKKKAGRLHRGDWRVPAWCVFCYLTLQWETAGQWLLAYPELHVVTVAAFILMGRYRGYQLAELWRFRDLASEPDSQGPA